MQSSKNISTKGPFAQALRDMSRRHERLVRGLSILRMIDDFDDPETDLDTVLRHLLETLSLGLRAENSSLMLLDPSEKYLELRAACSPLDAHGKSYCPGDWGGKRFRVGEGVVGKVVETGKAVRLGDTRDEKDFEPLQESDIEVRSLLCYPLLLEHKVVGVLNLSHSDPEVFSIETEKILALVARRAARLLTTHLLHQRVRKSEAHHRLISENAADGVFVFDRNGKALAANPAIESITLVKPDRFIQGEVEWSDIILEEDRERVVQGHKALFETCEPTTIDYRVVDAQGQVRYLETRCALLESAEAVAVVRDATERRRAERERLSLTAAVEETAEPSAVLDREGRIQYVNPAFERSTERDRQEIVGEEIEAFFQNAKFEEDLPRQLRYAIRQGDPWQGRLSRAKENSERLDMELSLSPLRNASGRIVNFVCVQHDISEQVELEAKLRQAQKMEAIGALAGGIAHDFNNILSALLGYAQLAQLDAPEGTTARRRIDNIHKAGMRATDLVKQILTFSKHADQEKQPVRLQDIIKEALDLLRASLPAKVDLRRHLDLFCPPVLADPTTIHQVIMNLCTNAHQAMGEKGGSVEVHLDTIALTSENAHEYPDIAQGAYARITVRDTGYGMDQAVMERVFEPYFTTKAREDGAGIGLATVHGIITSLKGDISIESQKRTAESPEGGTTFRILLPMADQNVKASEKDAPQWVSLSGTESILFVDDEEMIVDAQKSSLELLGYEVVGFTSSAEALELFRADPERFDIVVTDNSMPKYTGSELAKEIKLLNPNLPIILCTGFSGNLKDEEVQAAGIREVAGKPVATNVLAQSIRRAIQETEQKQGANL